LITTGAKKNRIKPRVNLSGFNWARVPVIIVEVGYLTSPSDDELLNIDEYQWKALRVFLTGF
jgi:N-acetylmuramoyl-L-alanine amidase